MFSGDEFAAFFPHRMDISLLGTVSTVDRTRGPLTALSLSFPACDDNGHLDQVTVNRVWWGSRDPSLYPLPPTMLRGGVGGQGRIEDDDGWGVDEMRQPVSSSAFPLPLVIRTLEVHFFPI